MPDFTRLTLEHLDTAVILLDEASRVSYLNPAAENMFDVSGKSLLGHALLTIFAEAAQLDEAMQRALHNNDSYIEHDLTLTTHTHNKLHLRCTVTPLRLERSGLLLEFHTVDRSLKLAREEQMLDQTQANRLLLAIWRMKSRTRWAVYAVRRSCWNRNWKSRNCTNTPRSSSRKQTGCAP